MTSMVRKRSLKMRAWSALGGLLLGSLNIGIGLALGTQKPLSPKGAEGIKTVPQQYAIEDVKPQPALEFNNVNQVTPDALLGVSSTVDLSITPVTEPDDFAFSRQGSSFGSRALLGQRPELVTCPKIEFPSRARSLNILKGTVTVRFEVSEDATLANAAITSANPADLFDQVALNLLKKCTFKPAEHNGETLRAWAYHTFIFDGGAM